MRSLMTVGVLVLLASAVWVSDAFAATGGTAARVGQEHSVVLLARQYSAFSRPRRTSDALPAGMAPSGSARQTDPHLPAIDVEQGRRVGPRSVAIYAMPSSNGACAALQVAGGHASAMGCTDFTHLGFVGAWTKTPRGMLVWGVAENRVRAVRVRLRDGRTVRTAVRDNGFAVLTTSVPTAITPVRQ